MSTKPTKDGKAYEISGSERGVRLHRILPKAKGWTRAKAVELERKLRADILNAKELGHVPDYSIGEEIMSYLKNYQGKARPDTHARALARFVRGRMLTDVVEVATRVANDATVTPSTRNRRIAILRRVAHLAYKSGRIKDPLHQKIETLPENPARTVFLTRSELATLLRGIPNRDMRRAALVLAFTGLRKGELLALKPVDVTQGMIRVSTPAANKGGLRSVPIIPPIQFCFKRLPFRFHPTSLSHAVSRASGGKVRVHDLRHTTASLLIQQGVKLEVIGAILGHSSRQTTLRYAHLDTATMTEAMGKLTPKREPKKQEKAA